MSSWLVFEVDRVAARWISGVVSAQNDQGIGLRGHDEVVPMEAADLVGPPGHCDTPPFGEERGVVTLRLGDPVGEGQRVDEVGQVEDALKPSYSITLQYLPARDLSHEFCDLRLSHPRRVAAAGDTPFGGQCAHRAASYFYPSSDLTRAGCVLRGPPRV